MERRRLRLCGILAMVTAAGCGSSGGGTGPTAGWAPTSTTNDATTIGGGMTGTCSSTMLRKMVPVTLTGGGDQFALGDGYLLADSIDPAYVYFVVPVRNLGSTMHCFVGITDGSYQGSSEASCAR